MASLELKLIGTLYAYTDWANLHVLDTAAHLSDEEYRREMGPSWGSVHGTLAHMLGAGQVWFSRWQGESPTIVPGADDLESLDSIRQAWDSLMAERRAFLKNLGSDKLASVLTYRTTSGTPQAEPLWQIMLHVANHATDHRSHVSIMLTELGHAPPQLDLIAYVRS